MAIGPGLYDPICTMARELAEAEGVILIVINGKRGSGFSCQGPPDMLTHLPTNLRHMADQIEQDMSTKN